MLRPIHIIMPMAGEGSRFLKEGWTTPKPLIKLHGMPLTVFSPISNVRDANVVRMRMKGK